MKVVVVGAGIIGLSVALNIKETHPDASVVVISEDLPDDSTIRSISLTTTKSGAHFRPFPSRSREDYIASHYPRVTQRRFKQLVKEYPNETSIAFIKGYDYVEKVDQLYSNLSAGYCEEISNFKVIEQDKYPNENVKFGAQYDTFVVNPSTYLAWLWKQLGTKHGIKFIHSTVNSLKEVASKFKGYAIVNATGIGLQYNPTALGEPQYDPKCYPIRGQVLVIKPPARVLDKYMKQTITYQLANGEWCFVIPRVDQQVVILGGTKTIGGTCETFNDDERDKVVGNARTRFPDLFDENGKIELVDYRIGLRPARHGGVRLEREKIEDTDIVHCYGFGGCGIEMSWGAAVKVGVILDNLKGKL